ncbi:MAG TPA: MBL fold metallo-hydrolase [bacterium]|nr:MAG: Ribonuclease Z [bacterium ADurb.Bin236]HPI78367.1 MBL fold metallo-hydrolase [bacterium]HPN93497.1 MBL fold metallo-hydrolase [bacterium]
MLVRFWGVRGSIPTPGPKTVRVGGNTSCVEIQPGGGQLFIMDAGSGIRELGLNMMGRGNIGRVDAKIFLSHTHWDHIHGWPFFVPAFIPGNKFCFYGPVNFNERLEDIVAGQMKYSYFPVKLEHMAAKIDFVELKESTFEVDGVKITAKYLNHPILTLGYRFEYAGKVVVTEFDTEPYTNVFKKKDKAESGGDEVDDFLFGGGGGGEEEGEEAHADQVVDDMNRRIKEFARDADLLIFDAQYTKEEYMPPAGGMNKVGWGHSTLDDAVETAITANVKRVALFHHEPTRADNAVDEMENYCKKLVAEKGRPDIHIFAAHEGMEVDI